MLKPLKQEPLQLFRRHSVVVVDDGVAVVHLVYSHADLGFRISGFERLLNQLRKSVNQVVVLGLADGILHQGFIYQQRNLNPARSIFPVIVKRSGSGNFSVAADKLNPSRSPVLIQHLRVGYV